MNRHNLPKELPGHSAFLRLSNSERQLLWNAGEVWYAPAGGRLFYPGDSGEELLLLLEGRLETAGWTPGERLWLPGDLWGEQQLLKPVPVEKALKAAESSMWIRWSREGLRSLASALPALRRNLAPVFDEGGHIVSGLREGLPSAGTKNTGGNVRHLRHSLRPLFPGGIFALLLTGGLFGAHLMLEDFPVLVPLSSTVFFAVWFLLFLIRRLFTRYTIEADGISSRSFVWSRFAVESRQVPADRIQGVAVERNGLLRRVLNYGSLKVKTSALEGELLLREVSNPEKLAGAIRSLSQSASRRTEGRNQEALRRSLEGAGLVNAGPQLIRGSQPASKAGSKGRPQSTQGPLRFRKSAAIMLARLVLPLLVLAVPVAAALLLKKYWILSLGALPLFWGWYRFEDWRNDNFQVAGSYAVDVYRKPLGLKESRRQVDLLSVQNIKTEQKGLLSFLFRFGNVVLVTTGGAADTVFENVARPWLVQETLFRSREEALRRREEGRRNERQQELIRFAGALKQLEKED